MIFLKKTVGKTLFGCFRFWFLSGFVAFRVTFKRVMLWLTFIHTFMGNRPKLADWSKLVCITPRSCLCSFPTSNWEVNADFSLNRFLIISQIVQLFVISSYIEGIETNLRIEKHTLRVFT